jgi:hypothetical protein
MSWLDALMELVGRAFDGWWLGNVGQRADLTATDYLLRASVLFGLFVVGVWLLFRFG